jgi:hypothetical protein
VLAGAALLAAYVIGLTYAAKKGAPPPAVVRSIAGIALLDAVLIASQGSLHLAAAAVAGFALTRILQRFVPGT